MNVALSALQVRQMTSLVVNVHDLLVTLLVERTDFVAGRRAYCLFEVAVQAVPAESGSVRDTVLLVDGLTLLGHLVLGVEVGESLGEAAADAVLLVEGNGSLDGFVANGVPVGEVLGYYTGSGLVVLADFVGVLVVCCGGSTSGGLVQ